MPNEAYTITNQKLYFAKLALIDWQEIKQTQQISLAKAYRERTVFHLHTILWAIYNEVANYYRFPTLLQPISLREWLTERFIENNPSQELNELFLLLNTDSALSLITREWENIFNPIVKTDSLISIKNIDFNLDSSDEAEKCLKQLSDLVIRFRTYLSEY